ncbi:hypothetical protein TorRG33x02_279790 [Trema orientale]|uniref:Uncharacterized protein n=1 Tax=Trema orientale TaxID=63057 RepID=A0A2P5CMH3_TREOI|nr:hypothetical protein TorRG33x02_279790 [Trema orientale]
MAGGASRRGGRSGVASRTRSSSAPTGGVVGSSTTSSDAPSLTECQLAICANAERFNNECGYIVRMHGSFHYKDWRHVPEEETFDINLQDKLTQKVVDEQMRRAWRGQKYKLHTYFKEIGGEHDLTKAKSSRHEENSDSRSKRKWESKNGSKKTPRHHVTQGRVLADRIGQIETWCTMHFDLETGWTGPDLQGLYVCFKFTFILVYRTLSLILLLWHFM